MQHALGIAGDDVLAPHAEGQQKVDAGDPRGAGAVDDEGRLAQFPLGQVAGVDEGRGGHDRRSMLVVMEDGNIHQLAQAGLDDEALGRLDVFEVDAAEGRAEEADAVDEFLHIFGRDFEVDAVDIGKAFEQARPCPP